MTEQTSKRLKQNEIAVDEALDSLIKGECKKGADKWFSDCMIWAASVKGALANNDFVNASCFMSNFNRLFKYKTLADYGYELSSDLKNNQMFKDILKDCQNEAVNVETKIQTGLTEFQLYDLLDRNNLNALISKAKEICGYYDVLRLDTLCAILTELVSSNEFQEQIESVKKLVQDGARPTVSDVQSAISEAKQMLKNNNCCKDAGKKVE